MKSNIFIPKKIKVGFQKRSDTYTNQLAYVIYFDEKGVLRKEASWQSWRDKNIEPMEFDNIPMEGFVLNKKVGGNNYSWNPRQTYVRVFDPRNFEFEITVPNLLFILENGDSYKGKGLSDKFVYGWDGKDLVLVPTSSPDYKELEDFNNVMFSNNKIGSKDLKIGATYKKKNNNKYIYLGKFDYYWNETIYIYEGKEYSYKNLLREATIRYNYRSGGCYNYTTKNVEMSEKRYWFYIKNPTYKDIESHKSISGKFIQCVDENCADNYVELFDKLERNENYSLIDESKDEYVPFTLDEFKEEYSQMGIYRKYIYFISNKIPMKFIIKTDVNLLYDESEYRKKYNFENVKLYTVEEVYDKFKPEYRNVYLRNGKLYKKEQR